jgi:hypothetical protein
MTEIILSDSVPFTQGADPHPPFERGNYRASDTAKDMQRSCGDVNSLYKGKC